MQAVHHGYNRLCKFFLKFTFYFFLFCAIDSSPNFTCCMDSLGQWMPHNFVADSFHTKRPWSFVSRLASRWNSWMMMITMKETVADFLQAKCDFLQKRPFCVLEHPFGLRDNIRGSS